MQSASEAAQTEEAPPAWLTKLENDRAQTQSKKAKLGHEFGRGAKCMVCLDKCPGLELHFWRKLCRVCKCRKDQHADQDCDEPNGLALNSHKLLGQKQSKATYLRLNQETVLLDWVPPNVDKELASDFMNQLDPEAVPIAGSDAATKRKQQLQYQMPIHDLEAECCDQLTEAEVKQQAQYVAQIKRKNVGQGCVVRIPSATNFTEPNDNDQPPSNDLGTITHFLFDDQIPPSNVAIVVDPPLLQVIRSEIVSQVLSSSQQSLMTNSNHHLVVKSILASDKMSTMESQMSNDLTVALQRMNIPIEPFLSYVVYGKVYDSILSKLQTKQIPIESHPLIAPISFFRSEFLHKPAFRQIIDDFLDQIQENANIVLPTLPSVNTNTYPGTIIDNLIIPSIQSLNVASNTSPIALKNCRNCSDPLIAGTVAVVAERAGPDAVWHPQCFKCCTCLELLADLVYFYHNGSIYCGRDLAAILRIPRCKACDELIFTKEYTSADNFNYHIKHFCCFYCDRPLAGLDYTPDDTNDQPLCLDCYGRHFAKACRTCGKSIGASEQGVSWQDLHWHAGCFRCNGCAKSLIAGRFCVKGTLPFCSAQCVKATLG